jgi:mannan endo-1,4-beta-mannosidase
MTYKLTRLIILCLALPLLSMAQNGFVTVNGAQLYLNGKPYRYIGTNYWYGGLLPTNGEAGKKRLKTELDFMKSHGITNLRVMVGAEGITTYPYRTPNEKVLQPEAGKFNENIMVGLDCFLNELGKRNMKAVLHFTNTWEWSGGIGQYLKWNGYGEQPYPKSLGGYYSWDKLRQYISQFYACQQCMDELDTYIRYVLHRTNSINGKKYTDDPAIMAWEIINEPRPMEKTAVPAFEQWIAHVSALVKSIDKNHLLTTGSEGDIASDYDLEVYRKIHDDKNVDYLTIHIWPKNWGWFRDTAIHKSYGTILDSARHDIDKHLAIAQQLNKPLVIEEFGLPRDLHVYSPSATTHNRDNFYNYIFSEVTKHPGIAGCNFWAFGGIARPIPGQTFWKDGDEFMGDPGGEEQGLNSVFDSDASTWAVITKYVRAMGVHRP